MSFGFSVGDFVALSTLTMSLYRSFKNAPGDFSEISRQLQSLHIVIADLTDQAQQENSSLNRNGATRGQELSHIHGNLIETMKELEDLHQRYQNMGRISWSRFQLGQENLAEIRSKLTVQISALNAFMGSLAISALGRMEPMLQKIHDLLDERVKSSVAVAKSVLSAASDGEEAWTRLELDLKTEGIPIQYIQDNRQRIKTVLCAVVDSNNLAGNDFNSETTGPSNIAAGEDDDIYADDSVSQAQNNSRRYSEGPRVPDQRPVTSARRPETKGKAGSSKGLSAKEEETRILIMNRTGFDVKCLSDRSKIRRSFLSRLKDQLQDYPAEPFSAVQAVCWAAAYGESEEPLKLFLDHGCDPSSHYGSSAMIAAVKANQWGRVKLLIDRGAKFDKNFSQMVALANQWELVKRLIERGAKPEKCLCHIAALADESEMIQILLSRGASVDVLADGKDFPKTSGSLSGKLYTALHCAAWNASPKATATLLQHGAQINKRTGRGWTPLHLASNRSGMDRGERLAVVKMLVEHGAHIEAKESWWQRTPLYLAAALGHISIVKYLLDRGADVNATNKENWTSLHKAAGSNQIETLKVLLDRGANIDFSANNGGRKGKKGTALNIAIEKKFKEAAKCLCLRGAMVNEKDLAGLEALGLGLLDADLVKHWSSLTRDQQDQRLPQALVQVLQENPPNYEVL